MKFKILTLIVILGVLSVIYTGKFDLMAFINSTFNFASVDSIDIKPLKKLANAVTDEKVQVYKWRDENGVMQFSNSPPSTDIHAEQVVVDTRSNVVQAVKVPVVVEEKKPEPVVKAPSTPTPYSAKGMKKVMDDARGVEEMLQKRHEEQQKMLNNI